MDFSNGAVFFYFLPPQKVFGLIENMPERFCDRVSKLFLQRAREPIFQAFADHPVLVGNDRAATAKSKCVDVAVSQ